MQQVGIDTLAFYTPRYRFPLATLARARGIDVDKYHIGLGQLAMSVAAPGEDVVTMAANAAIQALKNIDRTQIEMLLFATESGIDQSKAAGLYVHQLLGLSPHCRVVELKQACYAGTAGIQLALPFLRENPTKKILVIAADIARYGLNTPGEPSQGAGAVAMVLAANPRILAFDKTVGIATENVMDFWRPNYLQEALVDGKYSSKVYLNMLEKSWQQYQTLSKLTLADHDYICYHAPVPRLVEKAHHYLHKINDVSVSEEYCQTKLAHCLQYARNTGNSYTAALYISFLSLLDNETQNLAGKRVGFYSYGSGCVAEFFSGIMQPHYREALHTAYHAELLASRETIFYDKYAEFFQFSYVQDGSLQIIPAFNTGQFQLNKIEHHKRIYQKVEAALQNSAPAFISNKKFSTPEKTRAIYAPAKLILSGEHAVVYGQPALVMAINRYACATVTRSESLPQVLFDLVDLSHHSHLSFHALRELKARIKQKYRGFIRGDYSIRDVLQKPFELAQFALSVITESLQVALPHGVNVQVRSDIPIGCGLGSSAATILSVMQAMVQYLDLPMTTDSLYRLALEAENAQHGRSSGIDLRVILNGGCLYVHEDQIAKRAVPSEPLYLVNTGTPKSTTGQCIEKAAFLLKNPQLQAEFAAVTQAMDVALQNQSWDALQKAIRENHRLLVKIGVVPEQVQKFITQLETEGAAAKICGAGAVVGQEGGAVLVATRDPKQLTTFTERFGYNIIPISPELRGVHAA